ncbi:MAG: TlpA family protein disulfide reductase [Xanthomonadales bacterium]|jgi:thiol-disulfide isomerase/thioredoxin|nr:TlpA family protein disulfide reductase [Xanthomonadales bacterium]
MTFRTFIVAVLILPLLAMTACSPASHSADSAEDAFKDQIGLGGYAIQYQGEKGENLSFDDFAKLKAEGKLYMTRSDDAAKTAVLQLMTESKVDPADAQALMSKSLQNFSKPNIDVGAVMPNVDGKSIEGKPAQWFAANGKYSLLSFYFAECVPCIAEVPELNAFAKAHPEVNLLGVTFDSADDARAFRNKHGLEIATIAEAQASIDAIGIKAYPTLILVDPNGKLVASRAGGIMVGPSDTGKNTVEDWYRSQLNAG